VLLIFAAISGPSGSRATGGLANPAIDESILGLLTILLVPLQLLAHPLAARGFSQKWSVEVERGGSAGPHAPQTA